MNRILRRRQLDRAVRPIAKAVPATPPHGWIAAVRGATGMSTRQLGARLGLSQQAAVRLESAERTGSISLKNLRRVAEAMECHLVYAFVPADSFDALVRRQAERVADRVVERVETSMALEDQATMSDTQGQRRADLVSELIRTTPRDLWDLQ
jgi:predicted DNA-binding mobile mystery protein A